MSPKWKRAVLAQIEAQALQLQALNALVVAIPEDDDVDDEERPATCPRCDSTDLAEAGEVLVCGKSNANIRGGEVVDG